MNNIEFFLQCRNNELYNIVNGLKALPEAEKMGYRPASKNRSAKELVDHFLTNVVDLMEGVESGVVNHRITSSCFSTDEAIEIFEKGSRKLMNLLDYTDLGTRENKKVPMRNFGNEIGVFTLGNLCVMYFFDFTHHRGQLSIHYRPMGATLPSIYGPFGKMAEEMLAKQAANN